MGTSTAHVEDEKDTTNNQVTFLKIFLFVKESFIPNMFCNMFLRTIWAWMALLVKSILYKG